VAVLLQDQSPDAGLNAFDFEKYWISFNSGVVTIGRGEWSKNPILSWQDPSPNLKYLSVFLASWNAPINVRNIHVGPAVENLTAEKIQSIMQKDLKAIESKLEKKDKDELVSITEHDKMKKEAFMLDKGLLEKQDAFKYDELELASMEMKYDDLMYEDLAWEAMERMKGEQVTSLQEEIKTVEEKQERVKDEEAEQRKIDRTRRGALQRERAMGMTMVLMTPRMLKMEMTQVGQTVGAIARSPKAIMQLGKKAWERMSKKKDAKGLADKSQKAQKQLKTAKEKLGKIRKDEKMTSPAKLMLGGKPELRKARKAEKKAKKDLDKAQKQVQKIKGEEESVARLQKKTLKTAEAADLKAKEYREAAEKFDAPKGSEEKVKKLKSQAEEIRKQAQKYDEQATAAQDVGKSRKAKKLSQKADELRVKSRQYSKEAETVGQSKQARKLLEKADAQKFKADMARFREKKLAGKVREGIDIKPQKKSSEYADIEKTTSKWWSVVPGGRSFAKGFREGLRGQDAIKSELRQFASFFHLTNKSRYEMVPDPKNPGKMIVKKDERGKKVIKYKRDAEGDIVYKVRTGPDTGKPIYKNGRPVLETDSKGRSVPEEDSMARINVLRIAGDELHDLKKFLSVRKKDRFEMVPSEKYDKQEKLADELEGEILDVSAKPRQRLKTSAISRKEKGRKAKMVPLRDASGKPVLKRECKRDRYGDIIYEPKIKDKKIVYKKKDGKDVYATVKEADGITPVYKRDDFGNLELDKSGKQIPVYKLDEENNKIREYEPAVMTYNDKKKTQIIDPRTGKPMLQPKFENAMSKDGRFLMKDGSGKHHLVTSDKLKDVKGKWSHVPALVPEASAWAHLKNKMKEYEAWKAETTTWQKTKKILGKGAKGLVKLPFQPFLVSGKAMAGKEKMGGVTKAMLLGLGLPLGAIGVFFGAMGGEEGEIITPQGNVIRTEEEDEGAQDPTFKGSYVHSLGRADT
ncbi:hypothetical protein KAU11_03570, partial [Candidatus Babeliales bacterium]|nr:hypothetical protein [Candidatus Babeliales bacterium]